MHKSFSIILAVLLVVALAIPCFASESISGNEEMDTLLLEVLQIPPEAFQEMDYWALYNQEGTLRFFAGNAPMYVATIKPDWTTDPNAAKPYLKFDLQDCFYGTWTGNDFSGSVVRKVQGGDMEIIPVSQITEMVTNHDIYSITTGEMIYEQYHKPSYCTGVTCPANDSDHNNICDACGMVLAYNLRSTLLDFAKAQAQTWSDTWPYYAVVAVGTNTEEYSVYMSNRPQVADEESGNIVTSPNGLNRFQVTTNSDGSFEASGNYGASEWVGNLIYANHTIENFRNPPLATVIQGVTGEAMKVEIPNLSRTLTILTLCGVGCLALLIGLKLFGKRSLLFLRR